MLPKLILSALFLALMVQPASGATLRTGGLAVVYPSYVAREGEWQWYVTRPGESEALGSLPFQMPASAFLGRWTPDGNAMLYESDNVYSDPNFTGCAGSSPACPIRRFSMSSGVPHPWNVSPDGNQLLLLKDGAISIDNGMTVRPLHGAPVASGASWTPDSESLIVFQPAAAPDSSHAVWLVPLNAPSSATQLATGACGASLSPDMASIAIVTCQPNDIRVRLVDRAGATLKASTSVPVFPVSMTWRPDGSALTFLARDRHFVHELVLPEWRVQTMLLTTVDPITFTEDSFRIAEPQKIEWQPCNEATTTCVTSIPNSCLGHGLLSMREMPLAFRTCRLRADGSMLIGGARLAVGSFLGDRIIGTIGADELQGGAGHDRLIGRESRDDISGGDGNDWEQGGSGPDLLHGGPGRDRLEGGAGADRVQAADGSPVIIECGGGFDTVTLDRIDTAVGCERKLVQR